MANTGSMNRHLMQDVVVYTFAGICFIGAFSRLAHGKFLPRFYEYQIDHAPDDESIQAKVIPFVDMLIGLGILWRPTKLLALILGTFFVAMGAYLQFSSGKQYFMDMSHLALGLQAIRYTV